MFCENRSLAVNVRLYNDPLAVAIERKLNDSLADQMIKNYAVIRLRLATNQEVVQSWLWFLPVLFLFDVGLAVLFRMGLFQVRLIFRYAVGAAFVACFLTSLGTDLMGLLGWTHTALVDFQNERLLVHFMIFLLGSTAAHQGVLLTPPGRKTLYIILSCTVWIPITAYIVFLVVPYVAEGGVLIAALVDRLILWLCFSLSLGCLLYLAIETFRRYFDHPGRIWGWLGEHSYYVYIVHVIVLGPIALLLLRVSLPSLVKYLILGLSTYVVSNFFAFAIRSVNRCSQARRAVGR